MVQPGKKGMTFIMRLLIVSVATFLYVYLSLYLLAPRLVAPASDAPASASQADSSE